MRRPCPYCAESIMAAAIVCRFCGRDVVPLNASRISPPADAATPTKAAPVTIAKVQAGPGRDELAEGIARAAKISVLNERARGRASVAATQQADPPARTRRRWRLSAPLRGAAAAVLLVGVLAVIVLNVAPSADLWMDGVIRKRFFPKRDAGPTVIPPLPAAATSPPVVRRPVEPPAEPAPVAAAVAPADLPAEADAQDLEPHPDSLDGAGRRLTEDFEALGDEVLKTAVRMEGFFAQARACNLKSAKIGQLARANGVLLNALAKGQPASLAIAKRLARHGERAQRAGRGVPCGDVEKVVLNNDEFYRERGLLR